MGVVRMRARAKGIAMSKRNKMKQPPYLIMEEFFVSDDPPVWVCSKCGQTFDNRHDGMAHLEECGREGDDDGNE